MNTKFKLFSLAIIAFSIILVNGCKKNNQNEIVENDDPIEQKTVTGTITLPDNSNVDLNEYSVTSLVDNHQLSSTNFEINVPGNNEFNFIFVMNKEDEVLMLSLLEDFDQHAEINSRTSALSLVMLAPWGLDLSEEARSEAIQMFKNMPELDLLEQEINSIIVAKKDLLDTNNIAIVSIIDQLIQNLYKKKSDFNRDESDPILFYPTGNTLHFENNSRAHTYVAGVYKEDLELVGQKYITIPGAKFINASVGDFVGGNWKKINEPPEVTLDLTDNGQYQIIVRSGLVQDETPESKLALEENVIIFLKHMSNFIGIGGFIKNTCYRSIYKVIDGDVKTYLTNSTPTNDAQLIAIIINAYLTHRTNVINATISCLDLPDSKVKFLKAMAKALSLLSKGEAIVNGGKWGIDLISNPHSFEYCNVKDQNIILNCKDPKSIELDNLNSGDNQVGYVTVELLNDIRVIVKDEDDNPMSNVTVYYSEEEGSVFVPYTKTDQQGIASNNWTLGPTIGEQTLTVTAFKRDGVTHLQGSPLIFKATGTELRTISKIFEGVLTGPVGEQLDDLIEVVARKQDGSPIENAVIHFSMNEGSVEPAGPIETLETGLASVLWTLGSTIGEQTLTITAFDSDGETQLHGSPLTYTATATEEGDPGLLIGKWNHIRTEYPGGTYYPGDWEYYYLPDCPELLSLERRQIWEHYEFLLSDHYIHSYENETNDYVYESLDTENCTYASVSIVNSNPGGSFSYPFTYNSNEISFDGLPPSPYTISGNSLIIYGTIGTKYFERIN